MWRNELVSCKAMTLGWSESIVDRRYGFCVRKLRRFHCRILVVFMPDVLLIGGGRQVW